eukprot:7241244-Lingulodinium_polyedra.AAC.1
MAVGSKVRVLPKDLFVPDSARRSLPFENIVNSSQACPWHSPAAHSFTVPVADLQVIQDAIDLKDLSLVENCWLGMLGEASHRMVWKLKKAKTGITKWYIPLNHLANSGVIAWPVQPCTFEAYPDEIMLEVDMDVKEPHILSVFDLAPETLEAASYTWLSPAAQHLKYPKAMHQIPCGIHPWLESKPKDVRVLAAEKSFWNLSKAALTSLANYWGMELPAGADLFETVYHMVQGILGLGPEATLQVVSSRLAINHHKMAFFEELAEIDEAVQVLEHQDQKVVENEKK